MRWLNANILNLYKNKFIGRLNGYLIEPKEENTARTEELKPMNKTVENEGVYLLSTFFSLLLLF